MVAFKYFGQHIKSEKDFKKALAIMRAEHTIFDSQVFTNVQLAFSAPQKKQIIDYIFREIDDPIAAHIMLTQYDHYKGVKLLDARQKAETFVKNLDKLNLDSVRLFDGNLSAIAENIVNSKAPIERNAVFNFIAGFRGIKRKKYDIELKRPHIEGEIGFVIKTKKVQKLEN